MECTGTEHYQLPFLALLPLPLPANKLNVQGQNITNYLSYLSCLYLPLPASTCLYLPLPVKFNIDHRQTHRHTGMYRDRKTITFKEEVTGTDRPFH